MAEEIDLDLVDNEEENINKVERRIKDLSEKVKLTASERDELAKTKETLEQENASIVKERDFFKDFSASASKFPGAAEYQDTIKEKVMSGYTMEDATIAVLAKEGKLPNLTPPEPKESPAGGSATTNVKSGDKPLSEMTQEEKLTLLKQAESKGDISLS